MPLGEIALLLAWIVGGLFLAGFFLPLGALVALRVMLHDSLAYSYQRAKSRLTIVSLVLALLGGSALSAAALVELVQGGHVTATLFHAVPIQPVSGLPGLPALEFTLYVDRLAAFFLLLIGGLSIGVSIYSVRYLCGMRGRAAPPDADHMFPVPPADRVEIATIYNLFVLAGAAFVASSNLFFLILCLEVSTLAFGALVLHKHFEDPQSDPAQREYRQSVKLYLIANHFGGMMIAVALLVVAFTFGRASHQTATLDLSAWYGGSWPGSGVVQNAVFLLLFAGFGIKAGVLPFHIWVAVAHPSSPTNTHAMSLGIMIKIALYGMIRCFFLLLHPFPWWWGELVLVVAGLTALVSVSNALYGRTLKEAFADHSVENIGIILAGIGLALIFSSRDLSRLPIMQGLAALALVAALYHLLNHAVFKGLLYLCTGAIEYLTGTVRLDELGGLIRRYRVTSLCFLIGAVAIAGMPPFNGFISEWLTLQAFLAGAPALLGASARLEIVVPLLLGLLLSLLLLAFSVALTALAFVKIVGEALLGSPRRRPPEATRDVPASMGGVMLALALLCVLLGLFPWLVVNGLRGVVAAAGLSLDYVQPASALGGIAIRAPAYAAQLQPEFLYMLVVILVVGVAAAALVRRHAARHPEKHAGVMTDEVWVGGGKYVGERMQYTGSAYTFAARAFLGSGIGLGVVQKDPDPFPSGADAALGTPLRSGTSPLEAAIRVAPGRSVVEPFRAVYNVIITYVQGASQRISATVQNGDIRRYLTYMLAATLIILMLFAWRSG